MSQNKDVVTSQVTKHFSLLLDFIDGKVSFQPCNCQECCEPYQGVKESERDHDGDSSDIKEAKEEEEKYVSTIGMREEEAYHFKTRRVMKRHINNNNNNKSSKIKFPKRQHQRKIGNSNLNVCVPYERGSIRKRKEKREQLKTSLSLAQEKSKESQIRGRTKNKKMRPKLQLAHIIRSNQIVYIASPTIEPPRKTTEKDNITIDDYNILPAEHLGIEDDEMYDRLMSIISGDDITPDDYDLLLQLDRNNVKNTLNDKEISEISIEVIGKSKQDIKTWKSSSCDICLERFEDLSHGTEVRHLPCKHTFCKNCIDHWFCQISTKCPNLSCYWQKDDDDVQH